MAIEHSVAHGSGAPETARTEIARCFRTTGRHACEWKR